MSPRRETLPRRNRTVRFSDEEEAAIERLAHAEGRSWSDMTRRLVLEAIDARDAQFDATRPS